MTTTYVAGGESGSDFRGTMSDLLNCPRGEMPYKTLMEGITVHIHSAYCSARDQNVRVAMTEEPTHEGQANLHDVEVICLDYGERCTGDLCPAFGLPRVLMGVRLARSAEANAQLPSIVAKCNACDELTELTVVDDKIAVCAACGSTNRWYHIETQDGDFVAVGTLPA